MNVIKLSVNVHRPCLCDSLSVIHRFFDCVWTPCTGDHENVFCIKRL